MKANSYDLPISGTVVDILTIDERLNYGDLKERIKGIIGTVSDGTLSKYLQKMEKNNLLIREDMGRGGKVFYSLTMESKKKQQLNLLRFNPQYELFRGIYAHIFLYGMTNGNSYASDNIQCALSEIHADKEDLIIDRIQKCYSDGQIESQLVNAREKQLRVRIKTFYQPISGTSIIESTIYRKNIFYQYCTEDVIYSYNIPGISVKDFIGLAFRPRVEDVQIAFDCLLKNDLIRPIKEFHGETRYILTDGKLIEFIEDLRKFRRIEQEFECDRWNHFDKPTDNDKERNRAFYSDKTMSDKRFNILELNRYEYKTSLKEEGKDRFAGVKKESEKLLNHYKNIVREYNVWLKNKHAKTLEQYSFFSDVFELILPDAL